MSRRIESCLALLACLACRADPGARFAVTPPDEAAAPGDVERWRADVEGLITDALAKGKSYEMLSELCRTAPHRLAGSEGSQRAIEWARGAMQHCGLENVRLEPVTVPHWERGERQALFLLDERGLPERTIPILALGGSIATPPEGISGELIVVRSFDELQARADEARGKLVLFDRPLDAAQPDCFSAYGGAVDQRGSGAVEAAKVGALAALVRSMTMRLDDSPHTGSMRYEDGLARVPGAAVSTRGADELAALVEGGRKVRLSLQLGCRWLDDAPSHNVVGEIVGREKPEEVIVVGGHLDAWDVGQGAHDDGAGCVHALEAARLIRARGLKPKRTIRVVLYMNEENGTRGAAAYFATHESELAKHVLALESDAGGFTPRGFSTDAGPEALAELQAIAKLLENASAASVVKGWGGVDIAPLAKAGVPLVGFRPDDERYFDYHHSERDTLEAVHPRELALGAGAIAGLLYVVADLPSALPRNPPPAN